jgi:hypothetical protein
VTCIVGLVDNGTVYMGGDSAAVSNWDHTDRTDSKVFVRGPLIIGFSWSYRMGQLLRFRLGVPVHPEGMSAFEWVATDVLDSVRTCFKDGGFAEREKEKESGGQFLVGYRGQLFTVHSDYQVVEHALPFAAIGCGAAYALGALSVMPPFGPRRTIEEALATAERFSVGVRAPFVVEELAP